VGWRVTGRNKKTKLCNGWAKKRYTGGVKTKKKKKKNSLWKKWERTLQTTQQVDKKTHTKQKLAKKKQV